MIGGEAFHLYFMLFLNKGFSFLKSEIKIKGCTRWLVIKLIRTMTWAKVWEVRISNVRKRIFFISIPSFVANCCTGVFSVSQADQLMHPDRLRLYALIAGKMVWPSSQGDVNVCENLDWKRCLAVHLWSVTVHSVQFYIFHFILCCLNSVR